MQSPLDPVSTAGAASSTAVAATAATTAAAESFTERLADEMKRIAAHASSSEQLRNGAELYHLTDGEEIEQVAGKTPYVVKAATPETAPAAATTATTATTATG